MERASEKLLATVERILFEAPDGGFVAARVSLESGETVTVRGPLVGVEPGATLSLEGAWKRHPKYGRQFEAARWEWISPKTAWGIERFLIESGIPGVGEKTAQKIVAALGTQTLEKIDQDPACLACVKGLKRKVRESIIASWRAKQAGREALTFLYGLGLGPGIAARIYKAFGSASVQVVRENPYRLCAEVSGIGFLTADRIARGLGIPAAAPARVDAALAHALAEAAAGDGHCYLPQDRLGAAGEKLLGLDSDAVSEGIARMRRDSRFVVEAGGLSAVYLAELWQAEDSIARSLAERRSTAFSLSRDPFEAPDVLHLTREQREAARTALVSPVSVITGGPGVGKTTVIRALVAAGRQEGWAVTLGAPTGRAAKRMEEVTGHRASTLHLLLRYNPHENLFAMDAGNQLRTDLVIVDEASMLDVALASHLLAAVPPPARIVFVGDVDQLPSVGPGSFLRDLAASGAFPVLRLTEVFRQAARSAIVANAWRVNRGELPELDRMGEDFVFCDRPDPEAAREMAVRLCAERIPERYGLDPLSDVQVLSPMQKGAGGVVALNLALQARLNPGEGGLPRGDYRLRAGDKVMQTANDYEKRVFNGDVGQMVVADETARKAVVRFPGREVAYEADEIDALTLAYACTIHKAQGSEVPAVVVVLLDSHRILLARNLLYTAITRGKRLVVLVGSRSAVAAAVRNDRVQHRFSRLAERLKGGV